MYQSIPIKLECDPLTLSMSRLAQLQRWRKISKSRRDIDLDQTMQNVKLVQAISIYYNIYKFQVDSPIIFLVIVYRHIHTHTHIHNTL